MNDRTEPGLSPKSKIEDPAADLGGYHAAEINRAALAAASAGSFSARGSGSQKHIKMRARLRANRSSAAS